MRPVRLDKLARGAGARTMLPAAVQVSPRVVAVHERLGFEAALGQEGAAEALAAAIARG